MEQDGQKSLYAYNPLNQLISVNGSIERQYQYDKRGNLTGIIEDKEKIIEYQYDAANRVDAFRSEGTQVKYLYNGMGQRVGIEKKMAAGAEGSTVTRMDYIPDLTRGYHNMLQERREDADGKVISVKNFLWDDGLIAMDSDDISQYILRDEMDTPIRLLHENGNLIESNDYDEFGNLQYGVWDGSIPFDFTGYHKDFDTGSYFAQAREYLPMEGRFAAKDAFGGSLDIPESLNGFSYCFCNPLRYWDPLGYYTKEEGKEAHKKLQEAFKERSPGDTEHRVPNYPYSDSGIGYIDFYLEDNGQGECEVYELKPNTQILNLDNSSNGVDQRNGYITALRKTAEQQGEDIKIDERGNTFDPRGWTMPSDIHKKDGLNIRYYTFPFLRPGMIYWGYVKQPGVPNQKKRKEGEGKNGELIEASEFWEGVMDKVAMEGGAGWVALGLIVTILVFIASHGVVTLPLFASVDCKNG